MFWVGLFVMLIGIVVLLIGILWLNDRRGKCNSTSSSPPSGCASSNGYGAYLDAPWWTIVLGVALSGIGLAVMGFGRSSGSKPTAKAVTVATKSE
jgi:hypothetical protein